METIGILGCGGLGGAMARGLFAKKLPLCVFDRNREKVSAATGGDSSASASSLEAMAAKSKVILCAVKPYATAKAMAQLAAAAHSDCLLVSCAAGVTLDTLAVAAPKHAVARAMPNVGAQYGVSMTAAVLGANTEKDRDSKRLKDVFEALGQVRLAPDEDEIHAAIALAGSGPAYFLLALEAMEDAGVALGLPRPVARSYAVGAIEAATAMGAGEGTSFANLRARITSPGGTTIAGLLELDRQNVRAAFAAGVKTTFDRSVEMSEQK